MWQQQAKCLPRQRVSVKMKSNSDPTGLPVAWSSMEPSAPAYLPVPPVMASLVLVPSSKKGPSTVRWPPGSRVVQVHSHSVLPVATVRMQEPLSVPTCRVLDALYTGLWKPSTSPMLSLGGWNICTVSVIACSTTWMITGLRELVGELVLAAAATGASTSVVMAAVAVMSFLFGVIGASL